MSIKQDIAYEVRRKAGIIRQYNTKRQIGEVISGIWRTAYLRLAKQHPQMTWLKTIATTPSKDIKLRMYLQIPDKQVDIDLPGDDTKLTAVAHGGGATMLRELQEIIRTIGFTDDDRTGLSSQD